MNTLQSYEMISPFGKMEECSSFIIDDILTPFTLHDITIVDRQYALSLWVKSDAAETMTICGNSIQTTTEWTQHMFVFIATSIDLKFEFSTTGSYYIYHPKLEIGNKVTDWSPSSEDMALNEDVSNNITEIYEVMTEQHTDAISTAESYVIEALKSYVETGNYSEFKQTVESQLSVLADEITMKFTEATTLINEVDGDLQLKYNEITTYFDFGVDGLVIGKSDSPYKTVQTNERYSMQVNGVEVLWIDLVTKSAHIPVLTITEKFTILGYLIDMDGSLNVNCEYIGGE